VEFSISGVGKDSYWKEPQQQCYRRDPPTKLSKRCKFMSPPQKGNEK